MSDGQRRDEMRWQMIWGQKAGKVRGGQRWPLQRLSMHAPAPPDGWMDRVDGQLARSLHCSSSSATCGHPLPNKAYAVASAHALAKSVEILRSGGRCALIMHACIIRLHTAPGNLERNNPNSKLL
jgi:hypothetical protein